MANFNLSPNMSLPIPAVGVDPGPDYANNLNSSLTILDQHNHTPGLGVQIPSTGININADLPMNANNLTLIRSSRYLSQGSPLSLPSDLGCVYVSGVDLYYNDGVGNQVRITQSGGVTGTPGSITNLTSPASASYVSANQTFVWQSDVATPANLDAGSVIVRNITASSNGVTIEAPAALSSNYSLVLPALPVAQSFMTLDNSGNIAAPWTVDGSTIVVSSNMVQVPASGITTTQIAAGSVTQFQRAPMAIGSSVPVGGVAIASTCGSFSTVTGTFQLITNQTITIVSSGRLIIVGFIDDASASSSYFTGNASFTVAIAANSSIFSAVTMTGNITTPPASYTTVYFNSAGTYTFTGFLKSAGGGTAGAVNLRLVAYEV